MNFIGDSLYAFLRNVSIGLFFVFNIAIVGDFDILDAYAILRINYWDGRMNSKPKEKISKKTVRLFDKLLKI